MTPMTITHEMQQILDSLNIEYSSHDLSDAGVEEAEAEKHLCIMEATAYVAGEYHTDEPVCVSDTITEFMVAINDTRGQTSAGDAERNKLKVVVPEIIGTRPTKKAKAYRWSESKQRDVQVDVTVPKMTKGYGAAEERRMRRLVKELAARGIDYYEAPVGDLSTEDAIEIVRILANIKNKV